MSYSVRIAGSDASFPCDPQESVLDAALKAGIEIPYSCRKGVCGNCVARVIEGVFERGVVSADAVLPGQELLCQCRPGSDLEIKVDSWKRMEPELRKRVQAKVYRNTQVAPDVSLLQLRFPAGQRIKFRAGQYLEVILPDGARRSYSMANPPHESDGVQLHIRHVQEGRFSAVVGGLVPGDFLDIELPYGQVELDLDQASPLLCVCGGTGFAPVKSLLDDLVKRKSARPVTLVWGSRDKAGLYLLPHVAKWSRSLPNFYFMAAVEMTEEVVELCETFNTFNGRVDAAVRSLAAERSFDDVYCCGSPPMVSAVKVACTEALGLDASRFHADVFVSGT